MSHETRAKFALGRIVATPGALEALTASGELLAKFLRRHVTGDWGELNETDRESNDQAIAHEGDDERQYRVMSVYHTALGECIWVITERDRSVTTFLLPSEY